MAEEFTKLGSSSKKHKASGDTSLGNFGRSLGAGATFGFQDEAAGALAKARGEDYTEARDKERAEYEAYVEKHPWLALGGEALGGLAPAAAAAFIPGGQAGTATYLARLGSLGNKALKAQQIAARVNTPLRLAATGAGYGALSGAGAAKEMSDIPGEAAKGAAIGAVAAPVVSKGLEKGSRLLTNQVKHFFPESFAQSGAQRRVLNAIREGGDTPESLRQQMLADRALGHETQLWNQSPILQQKALGISTSPSAGMQKLQEAAWKNQFDAKKNVVDRINRDLASEGGQAINPTLKKAELEVDHAKAAKKAYDEYKALKLDPGKTQELEGMLDLNPIQKLLHSADEEVNALRKAANPDQNFQPLFVKNPAHELNKDAPEFIRNQDAALTPEHLEYVKKALDARVTAGYKSSDASVIQQAEDWSKLRNKWRDATVEATRETPEGKSLAGEARRIYGEGKNIEEAVDYGRNELRKADPSELQQQLYGSKGSKYLGADRPHAVESDILGQRMSPMTEAERKAVQLGYVQNLRDTLLNKKQNVNAYSEVLSPNEQERIAILMKEDPEKATNLINYLMRGKELFGQSANLTGGSKTAHALAARESLGHEPSLSDAIANLGAEAGNIALNPVQGSAGLIRRNLNKVLPDSSNYNIAVENHMGDILTKGADELPQFISAGNRLNKLDARVGVGAKVANTYGTMGAIAGTREHALDPSGYADTQGAPAANNDINSQWVLK